MRIKPSSSILKMFKSIDKGSFNKDKIEKASGSK
jgi:hypothetical protein